MFNNQKKQYEVPTMEVLRVRVERGYTVSGVEQEQGPRYIMGDEIGNRFN